MGVIKAVLCDLDGTLLDTNSFHAEAWQKTLAQFGYNVSFEDLVKQVGKGADNLLPLFVPKDELERISDKLEQTHANIYHREYLDRVVPFTDARKLLERMRQHGLRIAVATSSGKGDLEVLKTIVKIHDLVEEDTTASDADKSKPAPDIFEAALKSLGIAPDEALALGDTPWDVEAAARAGVKTVAVMSGGWSREELQKAGALAVYVDAAELVRKFDDSPFVRSANESMRKGEAGA